MQVPLNNIPNNINMMALKNLSIRAQIYCCQIRESYYGTLIPILVILSQKRVFFTLEI